jgi:hypothetical protein
MTNTCPFTQTIQSVGLIIPHIVAAHSVGANQSVNTLASGFVVPGVQCSPVLIGANATYSTIGGSALITISNTSNAAVGMQLIGQGIGAAVTIASGGIVTNTRITMTTSTGMTTGVDLTGQIIGIAAKGTGANAFGGPQLLCTAGADGSILKSLRIASTDTTGRYVSLWIQPGGTGLLQLISTLYVEAESGFYTSGGVRANVDILGNVGLVGMTTDQTGLPVLPLAASTKVYVSLLATLTDYKALHITATLENF